MDDTKNYTIWKRRHDAVATPDIDEGMLDLPGVEIVGTSPDHAEVRVGPGVARDLQNKLGPSLLIEEVRPRQPSGD